MKVDPKAQLAQLTATKAQPFKQLLAEARSELKKDVKPPALPVAAPVLRAGAKSAISSTTATATTTNLGRARTQANSEAQRLGVVRTEAQEVTKALTQVRSERSEVVQEKADARILDFILKEFAPEPTTQPRVPTVEASSPLCSIGPEASASTTPASSSEPASLGTDASNSAQAGAASSSERSSARAAMERWPFRFKRRGASSHAACTRPLLTANFCTRSTKAWGCSICGMCPKPFTSWISACAGRCARKKSRPS